MTGRMGAWSAPMHTMFINGATEYAIAYCNGEFTDRADLDKFTEIFSELAGGRCKRSSVYRYRDWQELRQLLRCIR